MDFNKLNETLNRLKSLVESSDSSTIEPRDIKPPMYGWILPNNKIIKLNNGIRHNDWFNKHNKEPLRYGESILSRKWIRWTTHSTELLFEVDRSVINKIKPIVEQTIYPWEDIYINDKKYDFDIFRKKKVF